MQFRARHQRQPAGAGKFVQQPGGDVIDQYVWIGGNAQHGPAMWTAHRDAMKTGTDQPIADFDFIQRAMRDRPFTFRTVTVIHQSALQLRLKNYGAAIVARTLRQS